MATNINEPWAECEFCESHKSEKGLVKCSVYNVNSLAKRPFDLWWGSMGNETSVAELKGKTFDFILKVDDKELVFIGKDYIYVMLHIQECCESVYIDDICGDLEDLIGKPIIISEELHSDKILPAKDPEYDDSFTWTFYKFVTEKGYVDIKWYGTSNGYYSESADLIKIDEEQHPEIRPYYIQVLQELQVT